MICFALSKPGARHKNTKKYMPMSKKRKVVFHTSNLNRKGFRMLSAGADVDQYKKNPILLFMHNRPWRGTQDEIMPLGTVDDIQLVGDEWQGTLNFDMDDPFAKKVADKWDKGIYRMVSVGATPVEFSDDPGVVLQGQRYATVTKWRLDEISVVDLGGNDDALSIKNLQTGQYVTLGDDNADLGFLPAINPNSNQIEIMKNIALKLGLAEDATEEQIVAAIGEKDSRIEKLQADASSVTLSAITQAVDAAIREKRITDKQKEHFVQLGQKTDLETLAQTLAAIEPAVKPTELINRGGNTTAPPADTATKKWEDLTQQERLRLRDEDPAKYKQVFEAAYGFAPQL